MKELHLYDFGIFIELQPDEEEKAILENNIQMSIKTDSLRIEDAITIRGVRNIKLANQMLMQRRKQYAVEKQQEAQKNSQMNAQIQQQSLAAKSQADMQAKQIENEMEMKKMQTEYLLKEQFAKEEHARRMKEIEMEGKMKAEHIKIAQEDIESDMTRIRKR